ncbi:MAG: ABC transporter transmembrane domain-containing protein [Sedimenticolaceae bacterium]
MENGIFKFIWRYSRRQQLTILAMTLCYMPLLYIALELPKHIVNDAIDGKDFPKEVLGQSLNQIEYLLTLCAALLALLVGGAIITRTINTYKGTTAERMIRRLRYQLYRAILLFPPQHFRRVTPSELATMITAEVEPMADFIGSSFSTPLVEGGIMLTILYFMFSQDPILGLVAMSMVPLQAWLIPKLQKKVNMLGRERVRRARKLAGWVGESVQGINDIHANDASTYMKATLSEKLGGIFEIRYKLFRIKFFMKSLNVFLSDLTPLIFYSVGGYLIINGELSLGALVAVLAAYAKFTAPWKELLRYYQRLHDVKIKYEQLIEQFQPKGMLDPARLENRPETLERLSLPLAAKRLSIAEDNAKLVDDVSFHIEPGERVAVFADPAARDSLAGAIARLISPNTGHIAAGHLNLADLPEAVTGASIGYAASTSLIFDGTVRDNMLLGLRRTPVSQGSAIPDPFHLKESAASGNSTDTLEADWIDYEALGVSGEAGLNQWIVEVARATELDAYLNARSLNMGLYLDKDPDLADSLLKVRAAMQQKLAESPENNELIRPFRFDEYNLAASVAANIVFGESRDPAFDFNTLGGNPWVRRALDETGLTEDLVNAGYALAEIIIDLFGDMNSNPELYESFSFVDAEILERLKTVRARYDHEGADDLLEKDKALLITLVCQLTPDKHRLGIVDADLQQRIILARRRFREILPPEHAGAIAMFDQDGFNEMLSNRCNIIVGRINHTLPEAEQRIDKIIFECLETSGLTERMQIHATGSGVGVGGSQLTQPDRQKLAVARSILKKPDILVSNDALNSLNKETQARIRQNMFKLLPDTTFIVFFSEPPERSSFDQVLTLQQGRITEHLKGGQDMAEQLSSKAAGKPPVSVGQSAENIPPVSSPLAAEAKALARVPIFADIDQQYLKLLAFNSQRIEFSAGDDLMVFGTPAEATFLILKGEVDILVDAGGEEKIIARRGENELIGILSLLSDMTVTATVRAATPVTALRIDREVVRDLMHADLGVAMKIARYLSDKLIEAGNKLAAK